MTILYPGRLLGPGLMTGSAVLFAIMNYCVKRAAAGLPGSEIAFVRFAFGLVLVLVLVVGSAVLKRLGWLRSDGITLSFHRWPVLVARGTLGGVAILLLYLALASGNLTNVTALNNSYAVFATGFGMVLLRERPGARAAGSLLISIVGMLLMVGRLGAARSGDMLALASSVVSGLAVVVVRELRKTESTWSIFLSLCVFGCLVCAGYGWHTFRTPAPETAWWLFGASLTGFVAQVSMTTGFRYCTASVGSILSISTVLYSGVLGYVLLGDRLTAVESLGALLVISGCVAVALGESAKLGPRVVTDREGPIER